MSSDQLSTDLVLDLATSAVQTNAEFQKCKLLLDQTVSRLKTDIKQETKRLEKLEMSMQMTRSKIDNHHEKLITIQKDLPELEHDLSSISRRAKSVHDEVSEAGKRYDDTNTRLSQLDTLLSGFIDNISSLDQHVKTVLTHRAGPTVADYQKLCALLDELKNEDPRAIEDSNRTKEAEIQSLRKDVDTIQQQVVDLKSEQSFYKDYAHSLLSHLDPSQSLHQQRLSPATKKLLHQDLALLRYMHDLNDQLPLPEDPSELNPQEQEMIWNLMQDLEEFSQTFCHKLGSTLTSIQSSVSTEHAPAQVTSLCSHCTETPLFETEPEPPSPVMGASDEPNDQQPKDPSASLKIGVLATPPSQPGDDELENYSDNTATHIASH